MVKVLLVSSEEKHYSTIRGIITKLDMLYNCNFELKQYFRICPNLKKEITDLGTKKIYILNVKPTNQDNLLKLAKFIRDLDWHSEIILIKNDSFTLSYKWCKVPNIFDVITNYEESNHLSSDMNLICRHMDSSKSFKYQNRDHTFDIYFDNILYVYRDTTSRKVVIITDNNIYNLNMDLKEVFTLLDKRFKQVHRSCIVNSNRTEKYDWSKNKFTLDTGKEVNMLSKHYKDNISF